MSKSLRGLSTWWLISVVFSLLALVGCGDDGSTPVLAVSPSSVGMSVGRMVPVSATVNGSPATSAVTWTSSNVAIATVAEQPNGSAIITAVSPGQTTVSVSQDGGSAQVLVTVTNAMIEALAVTPPTLSIAAGTTSDLAATATLSDTTTRDVTDEVTWSSSDSEVATVDDAGVVSAVAPGTVTITATLGALSASSAITVTDAVLVSLAVTPTNSTLAKGLTQQMTATGTFSDASTQDLTSMVTWASSAAAVAAVSTSGLVTAVAVGNANISATLGAISGQTMVTVTAATLQSLTITPIDPSLAVGLTLSLTATGTYSDSTTADLSDTATWMSSDLAVATTAGRVVTAVATGNATISATMGGITGTTTLTVTPATLLTIEISPPNSSLAKGRTQQLTATGMFSDGSNQNITTTVTWSSSDNARVSVSNAAGSRGLASALGLGAATVSATLGAVTGTTTLTVTAAEVVTIAVTPATFSVAVGATQQLTATATYTDATTQDVTGQATWTSAAPATATVSNAAGSKGLVTGVAMGTTTISAALTGITGSAAATVTGVPLVSIAVTPATASLSVGQSLQYTATGTYADSSTQDLTGQVTWASDDVVVADISNAAGSRGLATGRAAGNVTISATLTGITGTASLAVAAVTLVSIAVTPATATIAAGQTQAMTATGTFSDSSTLDLTTQVTWASSATGTATVSNVDGSRGVVTGVAAGSATISATQGAVSGTATVTVTPPVLVSIAVTPATATINVGDTQALTATAVYSDSSMTDVTATAVWDSTNKDAATVSGEVGSEGVVTGVGAGTTSITAVFGGVTGSATITVEGLVSIAISTGDVAQGTTRQLIATGTFSDGSMADVTELATWTSSDPAALTVNDAAGRKGLASAVTTAGAIITAEVGLVTGSQAIGGCKILVNEVQTQGTAAADEWVEIASACVVAQDLTGLRLVYRSAAGTSDTLLAALNVTIPAGGYLFYVNASAAGNYDGEAGTFGAGLAGGGGGVAVQVTSGLAIVDSMGYGTATNAFIEGAAAGAPSTTQSVARTPDRADTNDNSADFALVTARTPGAAN